MKPNPEITHLAALNYHLVQGKQAVLLYSKRVAQIFLCFACFVHRNLSKISSFTLGSRMYVLNDFVNETLKLREY